MITTVIDHGKEIVSNTKNVKTDINPTEVTKNKSINISVNKNLKDDDVTIEDSNDRREENSIYTFNNFCVDYSKRGTAKCKICKKNILKDELRMGSYASFKGISIIYHSHVPCFFKRMKRARVESNVIHTSNEINGFEKISKDDQIILLRKIEEYKCERVTPLSKAFGKE